MTPHNVPATHAEPPWWAEFRPRGGSRLDDQPPLRPSRRPHYPPPSFRVSAAPMHVNGDNSLSLTRVRRRRGHCGCGSLRDHRVPGPSSTWRRSATAGGRHGATGGHGSKREKGGEVGSLVQAKGKWCGRGGLEIT